MPASIALLVVASARRQLGFYVFTFLMSRGPHAWSLGVMRDSADVLAVHGVRARENLQIALVQDLERVELVDGLARPDPHGHDAIEMVDQQPHVPNLVGDAGSELKQDLANVIRFKAVGHVVRALLPVERDETPDHLVVPAARDNQSEARILLVPCQTSRIRLQKLPERGQAVVIGNRRHDLTRVGV